MKTTFNSHRRLSSPCSSPSCDGASKGGCSNRAQRRGQTSGDRETDTQSDITRLNMTKGPEMSSCVRSGDCAAGLCCARYLTGKRCQRILAEGEACLLKGSKTKLRRNLGRCDCGAGLTCTAVSQTEPVKTKGQGVCLPSQSRGQRKTRHSGKKRRPAETGC
ncbi:dickkopf-related protein 4-like [Thalassophryne amazonica]|uniref:dickkopf-related protein 4-like n=1 Tax=Thalassophryne amazonica TaxID=390379 RepID=UPI00147090C0|nr:dickkopf-related protein 4-like [Thalassophryne amazonica]